MSEPTAAEYAAGLRQLADMIEANPDIRVAYLDSPSVWNPSSPEEIQAIIRAGKAAGGHIAKDYSESMANVAIEFGPLRAMALIWREQVCERVVVGTTTVLVPDPEHTPDVPMIESTVDVTEWRCRPMLADEAAR